MKFAFISPSGAGKTTIINFILQKFPFFSFSKSYTTRTPRNFDDNEYIFVSKEEFIKKKEDNFFLESEELFSNFYGTPRIENENIIFNIDIKGLYSLKKLFRVISIGIIAHPTELEKRLIMRGESNISERMQRYTFEISQMKNLDFLVINDNLNIALKVVEDIFNIYLHNQKAFQMLETIE